MKSPVMFRTLGLCGSVGRVGVREGATISDVVIKGEDFVPWSGILTGFISLGDLLAGSGGSAEGS